MKTLMRTTISVLLLFSTVLLARSEPSQDGKPQVQGPFAPAPEGRMSIMIADEVRHQLLMLPYYGVFDWLECEIKPDNTAVLRGQVTRDTLKADAEASLRKLEGVRKVENQIEILPPSPSDDRIRLAVYRSIFKYEGSMFRYAIQATPPIHIIVNNGRVTLKGVVDNAMDSQLAFMAANGISGVFEVKNELTVAGKS